MEQQNPYRVLLNDSEKMKQITECAFNQIDKDKNGKLDFDEMYQLLAQQLQAKIGQTPTKTEIGNLMNQLDTNNDGVISPDEFNILMRLTIQSKADYFDKMQNLKQKQA